MTLAKYKFLRGNSRYELVFKNPVLELREMASSFFQMILSAVPKVEVPVSVNEFSFRQSNVLSENQARYAIYGGGTSVAMQADRLIFDFPGIVSTDLPILWRIVRAVHDAFPAAYPQTDYVRIETTSGTHLAVQDVTTVQHILSRFDIPNADEIFGKDKVIIRPVGKIDLVAADQSWTYSSTIEQSLLQPNALFVYTSSAFREMSAATSFEQKIQLAQGIVQSCVSLLGLEADATQ